HQPVALLGDHRGQEDVAGVLVQSGHFDSSSAALSASGDSLTAFTKPAALAASSVANQTSALVRPNQGESSVWYFIEPPLRLMVYPSVAGPPASGTTGPP